MSENNITRRDFLRRASKDAVDTGARIIPGGQLAKKFVEGDNARPGDFVENQTRKWWERLVVRNRQDAHNTEDSE